MRSLPRWMSPVSLALVLALASCSDDDNPTDGGIVDETPPSVASVTAVDAGHIDVVFSEPVTRASAENTSNYSILIVVSPASPTASALGGQTVVAAALSGDGKKVTITTTPDMLGIAYDMWVENIVDEAGNTMGDPVVQRFTGSTAADNTAPVLVYRKPAPNSTNQSTTALIELTFSEPIQQSSLEQLFGLGGAQGQVPVAFTSPDDVHFYGDHDPLALNSNYDIVLHGVLDYAGNPSSHVAWTFQTTAVADKTPPALVSSTPANLATNVGVNAQLILVFSERIDAESFTPFFTPEITGTTEWSLDGKTLTFTPATPLPADTQFELEIFPGDVADLAGNVNTALFTVVFSTGPTLQAGSIAGTLTGDASSSSASNPAGALVAQATAFPFSGQPFSVLGAATAASNGAYTNQYLRDGTYYPLAIKNTVKDGFIDPYMGDAIGFYGVDYRQGDLSPDSVVIAGGSHATNINFKLYDPTAVYGTVDYNGVYVGESHSILVGIFETAGFDPATSQPVAGTEAYWPDFSSYVINSIDVGPIAAGNYYVGAFLDVNDDGDYQPATEPAGLFGGTPPDAVDLSSGKDAPNTNILLLDPTPGMNAATSSHWKTTPHAKWLQNVSRAVREAQVSQR
ncbi:MAG TPA: Ig-like domain-containing protein [Candidatus Krumholzibacteria bacterium]